MNIVTRLQNLLAKIAGRDIDLDELKPPGGYNTDEQLMIEIANRLDKVEKASAAGFGNKFVINFSLDKDNNMVCDKTFEEIKAEYGKNGVSNMIVFSSTGLVSVGTTTTMDLGGEIASFSFAFFGSLAPTEVYQVFITVSENEITSSEPSVHILTDTLTVNATYSADYTSVTFDKTWQEIYDALASGIPCYAYSQLGELDEYVVSYTPLINAVYPDNNNQEHPYLITDADGASYNTDAADGYPGF